MKKIIIFPLIFLITVFISSCSSTDNPVTPPAKGMYNLTSSPAGASIFLDGEDTGFITPHTIEADEGGHDITFSKENYQDTTALSVSFISGDTGVLSVDLTPKYETYGPVRLWETTGTDATQPSGLDLSTGNAYGISSSNKDSVDIFYSSDGFLVKSASLHKDMTRETWFSVGSGTELNDGIDSPQKDNSWLTSMSDRETHYVFLYDNDGNYSKIKIVNFGGGTPGNPAWVEVQWIYNKATGSFKF